MVSLTESSDQEVTNDELREFLNKLDWDAFEEKGI